MQRSLRSSQNTGGTTGERVSGAAAAELPRRTRRTKRVCDLAEGSFREDVDSGVWGMWAEEVEKSVVPPGSLATEGGAKAVVLWVS